MREQLKNKYNKLLVHLIFLHFVSQIVLKLFLWSCKNIRFNDPERFDEFDQKEDNLDAADDGESCEKSHSASDETKLCVKLDLLVAFYLVKGCRVKVDLNQVKRGFWS